MRLQPRKQLRWTYACWVPPPRVGAMLGRLPRNGNGVMVARMKTLLLAGLALCTSAVLAQGYPTKPVRLVIGYTPGGSAEAGARPLARALEPLLGPPLVFE